VFSAVLLLATACTRVPPPPPPESQAGYPQRGALLIEQYGCGSCHTVPGVDRANGLVGPPLIRFGSRSYIAGELPNNADNLRRWIEHPQSVEPGTAMPDLGVSPIDAQDIAAYLLTLD
jgi:cytochrome c1